MLVVISDLHLTDGSSGDTINGTAFRVFKEDLTTAITDACYRKSDSEPAPFVPIDQCDLILNGDILDVIRTEKWRKSGGIYPWSDNTSDAFIDLVANITEDILTQNKAGLDYLKALTEGIVVYDREGREYGPIPVKIHYLVGNHDWFFHLSHPRMNGIREKIVNAMGLSNDPGGVFPHRIEERGADVIENLCETHQVYIQHGDLYDEINYDKQHGRDYSSLGDAIVVLLLNAFPAAVKTKLNLSDDDPLYLNLKEIDNVRPMAEIPSWVYGTLRRHAPGRQFDQAIDVWNDCLCQFLKNDFVKGYDKPWQLDLVDGMQAAFALSSVLHLGTIARITDRLAPLLGDEDTYIKAAMNERWLSKQGNASARARFVSYGHTHTPLLFPIDEVDQNGERVDQIYFNSGTWRRVHRRCERIPKEYEYTKFHVMTYLIFYKDGERNGRPYEMWTGQLGS